MMQMMRLGLASAYLAYMDGWEEGVSDSIHVECDLPASPHISAHLPMAAA